MFLFQRNIFSFVRNLTFFKMRKILLLLFILSITVFIRAQSDTTFVKDLNKDTFSFSKYDSISIAQYDSIFIAKQINTPYNSDVKLKRDWARLGYCTGMYIGMAAITFGVLWVGPEGVSRWDKEKMKTDGLTGRWTENIHAGPVWDEDDWELNYLAHPYAGAIYYMTARSCGFRWWESFGYSVIMSSFFWEYGLEAFAEVPSWQDLIVTPTVGSILGEGFWIAKKAIVKNDSEILNSKILGGTALLLMDPFNQILDWCGYKEPLLKSSIAPVGCDFQNKQQVWGVRLSMNF